MNMNTSNDKKHIYQAKWPNENDLIEWTDTENSTWHQLITRQMKIIENRACKEFIAGLEQLNLPIDRIPQLPDINHQLAKTGWSMQAVSGTILVNEFFSMLKNKVFPVANFIRIPEELDYLSQPDVFHELFGHAPLLLNQTYADFMQWYGEIALQLSNNPRKRFSRLFWYTIEFGLIQTSHGIRILGGGILSSHQETLSCLNQDPNHMPQRKPFNLKHILQSEYDYKVIQAIYFILESMEQLYKLQNNKEIKEIIEMINKDQDDNQHNTFINC